MQPPVTTSEKFATVRPGPRPRSRSWTASHTVAIGLCIVRWVPIPTYLPRRVSLGGFLWSGGRRIAYRCDRRLHGPLRFERSAKAFRSKSTVHSPYEYIENRMLFNTVTTGKCCNCLNSWPWSTWSTWPADRFRRCLRHAWLNEWDYEWLTHCRLCVER